MQGADYVLKCDIRKYFASVDHAILKELLRRKIGCPRTLWLMDLLIDHSNPQEEVNDYFEGDDLFTPLARRRGLPVGNQTSQFFANVYLNPLDHFLKETLGCRRYIRYVDDFVVLSDDREELWQARDAIEAYLHARLRLRLHPRKQYVAPVTAGIDFLGYRVYPTHRRLRRSSGLRFARRLKRMQLHYRQGKIDGKKVGQRVASWIGHAAHADTYGLRMALLERAVFRRA
jgi:retron-type reverse transcriptase